MDDCLAYFDMRLVRAIVDNEIRKNQNEENKI